MATVREVLSYLDFLAPIALQEDYDNSGLQLGSYETEVKGLLLCLDVTSAIIDEAIDKHCNIILAHHPLFFKPLRSINFDTTHGKIIQKATATGITILAFHTNFDNQFPGLNQALAQGLHLRNLRVLKPMQNRLYKLVTFCPVSHADQVRAALFSAGAGHIGNYDSCSFNTKGTGTFRALEGANPFVGKLNELHHEPEERIEVIFPAFIQEELLNALISSHPYEEVAYDIYPLANSYSGAGSGIVGELPHRLPVESFLNQVKEILGTKFLRISSGRPDEGEISSVAICGGSGSFLIPEALRVGASVFITADLKYHDFTDYGSRILLVDAGHYETEIGGFHQLSRLLKEKFTNFAVHFSETGRNPVRYV
ncbi:MAG: Nif3-like dinuclear metal center hexameric protein [Bacteroidales bacterium]